jgi:outer membrane protein assembly factor BamB
VAQLNLILLGPPGAGKGTQAERLVDDFDLPYYATGDILRGAVEEQSELGRLAKQYMDRGDLVPDELIIRVIMVRLDMPGIDPDTFSVRWMGQVEAPASGTYTFYTVSDDGVLSRSQIASDGVVDTVQTPHDVVGFSVLVFDGIVFFYAFDDSGAQLVAYDAATLTPRWTVPGGTQAFPCGLVVCVTVEDPAEQELARVTGVDPATGAIRWSLPCPEVTIDDLCLAYGQPLAPGDLLWVVLGSLRNDDSWSGVVDVWTGQGQVGPSDWSLAGQLDDTTLLLSREEYAGQEDLPDRLWWARSRADLSRLEILGTVEASWCSADSYPVLVCWDTNGPERVSVWRILEQ